MDNILLVIASSIIHTTHIAIEDHSFHLYYVNHQHELHYITKDLQH
jgi:hypothetical protein